MSRPIVVLYHGNCTDGFCSAWISHKWLGATADYIPVLYGQATPDVKDKIVYLLDFSYKEPILLEIISLAKEVILIDHHEQAYKDLESVRSKSFSNFKMTFDGNFSGAYLTWKHFFPTVPAPLLVRYVQDRDLWTWELERSKAISAAIASCSKTFESFDYLEETIKNNNTGNGPGGDFGAFNAFANEGDAIIRYQQQVMVEHIKNAVEHEIAGHKVLVTNCSNASLISEVGEKLSVDRAFGATFYYRMSDNKLIFSLRSRPPIGIDVSVIAKMFGGNGHVQAAGFQVDHFPWLIDYRTIRPVGQAFCTVKSIQVLPEEQHKMILRLAEAVVAENRKG